MFNCTGRTHCYIILQVRIQGGGLGVQPLPKFFLKVGRFIQRLFIDILCCYIDITLNFL